MHIDMLPDEILEHIFINLLPCRDYKSAMLVNRRWHRIIKDVAILVHRYFLESFETDRLIWSSVYPLHEPSISERYSHCACFYNKIMYVFGGCTAMNTTFNDLWAFDIAAEKWVRCLASGAYPSPKAYASLVMYNDKLILFGGWSYPTPYPLHQSTCHVGLQPPKFFNELHTYTLASSRWELVVTVTSPPPMAGQGATVIGDQMIVYGGCVGQNLGLNEIWVLDLRCMDWTKVDVCDSISPSPRYGHCQVAIDDEHLLIVGGCGGPNKMLSDAWLLNVRKDAAWSWTALKYATASPSPVAGSRNCAAGGEDNYSSLTWCHPCCKVGDSVVFLSHGRKSVVRECSPDGRKANGEHRRRSLPNDASSSDSDDCSGAAAAAAAAASERPPRLRSLQAQDSRSSNAFLTSSSANCDHQLHDGGEADDTTSDSLSACLNGATNDSNSVDGANVRGQDSTAATSPSIKGSSPNGSLPSVRPNARKNRQKQLEALRSYEQRLRERTLAAASQQSVSPANASTNGTNVTTSTASNTRVIQPMCIHRLDVSDVVATHTVAWQPQLVSDVDSAPSERLFYTLVEGWGELLLFGGIRSDQHSPHVGTSKQSTQTAGRSVYFLRALVDRN